jgi:site-specific recombinase XerD
MHPNHCITPQDWYQCSVDALLVNGKGHRTAETYSREVRILARWLGRPLPEATEEDIRRFVLYRRVERKLSGTSMRLLCVGLRFFFRHVIERNWPVLDLMNATREQKLPTVLTREEVWQVIHATTEPHNLAYFQTVYTCGLRLSEGLNLTVHDIDGKRLQIKIRAGKGAKDRLVPLPRETYELLRRYWLTHRHPLLIFPALGRDMRQGPTADRPMNISSVQGALRRAVRRAGITKPGVHMHTLRHCYATHLLEAGVNVHAIQRYLGHARLETTLRYFHLTTIGQGDAYALIDRLMKEVR